MGTWVMEYSGLGRGRSQQTNISATIITLPTLSHTPAISSGISSRRWRKYRRSPRKLVVINRPKPLAV